MVGERMKVVRKDIGITQKEMAEKVGIASNTLAQNEGGSRNPSEPVIRAICREFSVSYDWLKNGVEPMYMPKEEAAKDKIERLMDGDNEFVKAVFRELADLPLEQWEQIEAFVDRLASIRKDR